MNETQVRLSAGADTAGTSKGPNVGRRKPVREEKWGEDKQGKSTAKHKKTQDT